MVNDAGTKMRTFRDHVGERRLFASRVVQAAILILLLVTTLIVRLVHLQVDQHEYFSEMSTENRVKVQPLPPTRGLIFDRKGRILAQNDPVHSLVLATEKVKDLEKTLEELSRLISIDEDDIRRFNRLRKQRRRFENIPLRSSLSDEEVAILAVNRHRFQGVDIEAKLLRSYPHGLVTSHVLGYVGRISEKDLQRIDPSAYSGTTHIGKLGLERFHEGDLFGQVGLQRVEVNVLGRTVKVLEEQPPVPGKDLYLSLDIDLQQEALDALVNREGRELNAAVVAIDPSNGEVLAMVSKPGFDPNLFVEGISSRDYKALTGSPEKPLFNRALQGTYPPGSTTKPFFGLQGLVSGKRRFGEETYCPGFYQLPGHEHKYRDWKKTGHGRMNLTNAVVQSCDVYFYKLAHDLGVQEMHDFMAGFGFGRKTGVDVFGEYAGLLPSPDWKRGFNGTAWYPGETVILGIGQGYFQVTPIELASATATLAAKGKRFKPHLVASMGDPVSRERTPYPIESLNEIVLEDPENWDRIHETMIGVVENPRGTARRIRTPHYRIAGKTGTAQVFTVPQDEDYDEEEVAFRLRDHALFVAFAPVEAPRIAVAVIVENGGHGGSVAAPIARRMMDRYLLPETP